MGKYTYIIDVATGVQDNNTYANKRIFTIKPCENTLIENNISDLWNNNLCSQDSAYCQPWITGDKLYFQFRNDRDESASKILSLINKETGAIIPNTGFMTSQDGVDQDGTSYYNVIIDTTTLTDCCFYLRITLFFCTPDPAILESCITTKVDAGETLSQATYDCMVQLCNEENVEEIFTEPFCKVECGDTILIEGIYPKYDCDLNYYGYFDDDYNPLNSYKCQVRVFGEITKENYSIVETIVNEDRNSTKMTSQYRLMTPKIPPYVANQMANAFNAQQVFIDGVEYKRAILLEKNNSDGNMWVINTTLVKICSDIDFLCE
jgi:hypothetical protein